MWTFFPNNVFKTKLKSNNFNVVIDIVWTLSPTALVSCEKLIDVKEMTEYFRSRIHQSSKKLNRNCSLICCQTFRTLWIWNRSIRWSGEFVAIFEPTETSNFLNWQFLSFYLFVYLSIYLIFFQRIIRLALNKNIILFHQAVFKVLNDIGQTVNIELYRLYIQAVY